MNQHAQYTIPVVMFSGKLLCYDCYQNREDETDKLHCWLPPDPYPVTCEGCGLKCLGEPSVIISRAALKRGDYS